MSIHYQPNHKNSPTFSFFYKEDNDNKDDYFINLFRSKFNKHVIVCPRNKKNRKYNGLVKSIVDKFHDSNANDCVALIKTNEKYHLEIKNDNIILSSKRHLSNFIGGGIKNLEKYKYQKYLARKTIYNAVRAEYGTWVINYIDKLAKLNEKIDNCYEIHVDELRKIYHLAEDAYDQYEKCVENTIKEIVFKWNKLCSQEKFELYINIFENNNYSNLSNTGNFILSGLKDNYYTRNQLYEILGISSEWRAKMKAVYGVPEPEPKYDALQDDDGWNCSKTPRPYGSRPWEEGPF
jgi:hypothetical protein